MGKILMVRECIEPMYQMGVSIQACGKYADKDFPTTKLASERFYCHNKSVADLKTEQKFKDILDYPVACVTWQGKELVIQVE